MHRAPRSIDRTLLILTAILVVGGYVIFTSASFGLLLKTEGAFSATALMQGIGVLLGVLACWGASRFPLTLLKKWALPIGIIGSVVMILVLIPGLGIVRGGAQRWFSLYGISVQPGEFFKLAFVVVYAALLADMRLRERATKKPFFIFLACTAVGGTLFLLQPDTASFLIMCGAGAAIYFMSGVSLRHCAVLGVIALLGATALFALRPYLFERLTVFLHPDHDPQGAGYQLQQSLIAVGSGGLFGKGFGRSVQKFAHLPEPTSDSIFAVYGEEFGLLGTSILLILFIAFTLRGVHIAARAPNAFEGFLALGSTMLIVLAAFLNIASMLGLTPLSGLTLPFISRGGTSLLAALVEVGLVFNVSRRMR